MGRTRPNFAKHRARIRRRVSIPSSVAAEVSAQAPQARREMMTLVSWNVDGLNQKYLHQRIRALCDQILRLDPDVVYLQEVVPEIEPKIRDSFARYRYIPGDLQGYYVVTLLKEDTVKCKTHTVSPFSSTKMERHIVQAEATFNNKDLVLLNTHLESMGYSSEVRQVQLRRCFRQCKKEPLEKTVILGGDMNLRDSEVHSCGGLPEDIQDVWTACGSDPGLCYTWDMTCNDNLDFGKKVTARLRFDRIYLRHSEPAHLLPVSFELIGQKRLETEQCFPSDHWGIAVQFRCL
ncbi:tyrosyl-DNA phosphodiesterase 2 isoform X3 [Dermacentor silvarum]|uniref:tyrosyl-DNA phosphodiesterase 2 isoform X3 n=1 Tax=Dermacentor silvarum TaxID=543639 RepID=UPI002101CD90|nr:tyrosyl-DNA phosphodiesterase 2 isoform X3 [Dermacentor silvarum]